MGDDIREIFIIDGESRVGCLVCSDDVSVLLDVLYTGEVRLCLMHLAEFQRRADAAEGAHLRLVEDEG